MATQNQIDAITLRRDIQRKVGVEPEAYQVAETQWKLSDGSNW